VPESCWKQRSRHCLKATLGSSQTDLKHDICYCSLSLCADARVLCGGTVSSGIVELDNMWIIKYASTDNIYYHRRGSAFSRVSLCVCLSVMYYLLIAFSFLLCRYVFTIFGSVSYIKVIGSGQVHRVRGWTALDWKAVLY